MIARLVGAMLALGACGGGRAAATGPAPSVPVDAAIAVDAPTVVKSSPEPMPDTWIITTGAVGPIALGQPLPAALLTDDLARRYVAAYIADGVAMEGFRFDVPPLTAMIEGGPFTALDRVGVDGPPPVDQLRVRGAAAGKAGAKVTMILVHGAGPVTAAGVGVGADLPALRAAYADLRLYPRPPTREDEGDDLCVARAKSLPGVGFVFTTCNHANAGERVKRVDLWTPE